MKYIKIFKFIVEIMIFFQIIFSINILYSYKVYSVDETSSLGNLDNYNGRK